MITITCTSCKAHLEIDEAFAGGVCRCQHCGTIQTVPAHLRNGGHAGRATPKPAKPLYQGAARGGTGLDELSDAVVSSGLARSALSARSPVLETPAADYARPRQQKKKSPVPWIALGGVAAVVLFLLVWLLLPGSSTVQPGAGPNPRPNTGPGAKQDRGSQVSGSFTDDAEEPEINVPSGPNFCGIDLSGATGVVYVLDRGSSSAEVLDMLKAATYQSVESLGSEKNFAIIFWDNAIEPAVAYPETGLAAATAANVEEASQKFEDIVAEGRGDPATALAAAAERGASDVIIVSRKGDDLPEEFASQVNQSLPNARVHAVALVEDYGTAFQAIASQRGGQYAVISAGQLRAFSRE